MDSRRVLPADGVDYTGYHVFEAALRVGCDCRYAAGRFDGAACVPYGFLLCTFRAEEAGGGLKVRDVIEFMKKRAVLNRPLFIFICHVKPTHTWSIFSDKSVYNLISWHSPACCVPFIFLNTKMKNHLFFLHRFTQYIRQKLILSSGKVFCLF